MFRPYSNKSRPNSMRVRSIFLNPSKKTIELLKERVKDISNFMQSAKIDGTYQKLLRDVSDKTIKYFETYAKKYMEILKSLKLGGSFIYAPSLPFIEALLISSNKSFVVETSERSTSVTRIK